MRINTNIAALTAIEKNNEVNKNLSTSLEKLSSGLRINKAADDASGMSIADKLRTQASSLGQSIQNANSGNALVQIADKAMAEQSNILDIVKTKLIQASTSTTSSEGREAIRKDVSKLLDQLDNIASQTNYNGINLLDKKGESFNFQVGEEASFDIEVSTAFAANTGGLGGGSTELKDGAAKVENLGDSLVVQNTGGDLKNTITATTENGSYVFTLDGVDITATLTDQSTDLNADAIATAIQAKLDDGSVEGFTIDVEGASVILRPSSEAGISLVEKTDAGTVASIANVVEGVAVNSKLETVSGTEATFSVGATNVDKITLVTTVATATVSMTTTDSAVINKFDTMIASGETNLTKTSEGVYALNMTASGTNAVLDFGAGQLDIGNIEFGGVAIGTVAATAETLVFQTTENVTVTNKSNVDVSMESANGTDFTTATMKDNLVGGNTLAGLKGLSENGLTADIANSYMETIDEAINQLNTVRSDFGSTQNQLDSFVRNAMTTQTNIKAAESVIRDVDYAAESSNFNKQNIISQAGTYAMSQANSMQQNIMRLLQ